MRRYFALLVSVALGGMVALSVTPAGAAMSVDVNPSTAVSLGWGFLTETPTGSGDFELGPATPPDGTGSARLTTAAGGGEAFGTPGYGGTLLSDISALDYSTYHSSADPGSGSVPTLQLHVDYDLTDLDTSWQGRLVSIPSGAADDTWQARDAYAGNWYATGAPGNTVCPESSPCSWATVVANFPDAGIHATMPGVLFKAGAWSGAFNGYVDAFTITTVGSGTDYYDFEPGLTTTCFVAHSEDLLGVRYRSFGNTGSKEIYSGVPSLDTTPRSESDITWVTGDNDFTITFDPGVGLDTSVTNTSGGSPYSLSRSIASITSDLASKGQTFTLADLNVMQVTVKNQVNWPTSPSVVVKDLAVDGAAVDADPSTPTVIDDLTGVAGSTRDWMLTGFDYVDGFSVSGTVTLAPGSGWGSSADTSTVEFKVGRYDETVTLNVGDASVAESGGSATVAISATGQRMRPVEFMVSTADVTATAGLDYTSLGDVIVFSPCSGASTEVSVPILEDLLMESTETFSVAVSNVLGATGGDWTGTVTITDNEGFRISDLAVSEGDTGAKTVVKFSVNLSEAPATATTVSYATGGGTAGAGNDYKYRTGTLSFKAGQTTKPATITIYGDTLAEGNETFNVVLSGSSGPSILDATGVGTILNDDSPPAGSPELRISDATVWEGNSGLKNQAWVTVSLSSAAIGAVTVDYTTVDGSATVAGSDYKARGPKTLSFKPGQTSKQITLTYYADTSVEGDEAFDVVLSSPTGAPIGDGTGTVTLRSED